MLRYLKTEKGSIKRTSHKQTKLETSLELRLVWIKII